MQNQEPPKIEFPCPGYPIKVLGDNSNDFQSFVINTLKSLMPEDDIDLLGLKISESRNGRFISVTVKIVAQSENHLSTLHKTFMDSGRVKMVM
jgi:putative lipoic acid-binding regulatory protein